MQLLLIISCIWNYRLVAAIWPEPRSVQMGSTVVWLSKQVELAYNHNLNASMSSAGLSPLSQDILGNDRDDRVTSDDTIRVQAAFDRFKRNVFQHNFVPSMFHPRGATFEPPLDKPRSWSQQVAIKIDDSRYDNKGEREMDIDDETYTLELDADRGITIQASHVTGILHGFETLARLFYKNTGMEEVYSPYAPVRIMDSPRFKHRGLNIDIARNVL